MTDLLSPDQVDQIREVMTDISDTFAFPITIRKTTYTNGAFQTDPDVEEYQLEALRTFQSKGEMDRFRNALGPAGAHEYDLFIGWKELEDAGLIDTYNKALLDHNDLVIMENEVYEIVAFGGVGEMTKKPTFLQVSVKRRFESPQGASPL